MLSRTARAIARPALSSPSSLTPLHTATRRLAHSSHSSPSSHAAHDADPHWSVDHVNKPREEKHGERYEKPWIFGEDPTNPRGWSIEEKIFGIGMSAFFVLAYIVGTYGPNTSMTRWAREEALHTGFTAPAPAPDLPEDPDDAEFAKAPR